MTEIVRQCGQVTAGFEVLRILRDNELEDCVRVARLLHIDQALPVQRERIGPEWRRFRNPFQIANRLLGLSLSLRQFGLQ